MLYRFKIKDKSYTDSDECAILSYDTESKQYSVDIPETINVLNLPAILSILAEKGVYHVDDRFARIFVKERVIPPERQNIGMILRDVGITEYDEFELLKYCSGRCCMDEFWLEEIN